MIREDEGEGGGDDNDEGRRQQPLFGFNDFPQQEEVGTRMKVDEKEKEKVGEGEEEGEIEEETGEQEEMGEEDYDPPPPCPEEEKELLFLIEFMVDTLTIIPKNLDTENVDACALQGPVTVSLTFLHFPPMHIGEKDVDPDRLTGRNDIRFNAGKSLMFALSEGQFEDPPPVLLFVSAHRDMPHAFRFSRLPIGKTKIQLSELFKQLFEKYDEHPEKSVSKSIKDRYELIGELGKPAGEISIYIRLTCLGENIVTEFQKGNDFSQSDPLLFKNKESSKVYECRPSSKSKKDESPGTTVPGWGGDKREPRESPCATKEEAQYDPDDENFEEIFAEINGSALTVRVEKSKRRGPTKDFHVDEFCDCNIPLPKNLVAGISDLSLSPGSEGSMDFGTGTHVKTDPRVGIDSANQLVFQVPPIESFAQPGIRNAITYNVKTCQEGEKHGHKGTNSFRIMTNNNPEGAPKMPNDPEKDVFVLKIIKRGKREKGKDVLELEFRTPKEKIEPPQNPPYMVSRYAGADKKKNGNGGKGKKKKK